MSNNFDNNNERRQSQIPSTSSILGIVFGIFMVIIYVGMGVLLIINFFNWTTDWAWVRWIVGIVLIVYGVFRGYRTFVSVKTHGGTDE